MKDTKASRLNIGDQIHGWTVVGEPRSKGGTVYVRCVCGCGAERDLVGSRLVNGATKQCRSCSARGSKNKKHGLTGSRTYRSWRAMKSRCSDPSHPRWERYGGRGITVCDRWEVSFEDFLADMGERPSGATLDRIDSDGHYEPSNCRWATPKQQGMNRSSVTLVEIDGETKSVSGWCRHLGLFPPTVYHRIRNMGMSPVEALTKPVDKVRQAAGRTRYQKSTEER